MTAGEVEDFLSKVPENVVVCFDEKTFLPLKLSMYDKDDTLLEEYEFDDLRLNVGLTDDDFQFRRK